MNQIQSTIISLFYDDYEQQFGDGFYPVIEKSTACSTGISITFTVNTFNSMTDSTTSNYWRQVDNYNIDGLDGNEGEQLLKVLNKNANNNCVGIVNRFNKCLYKKI